MFTCDHGLAMGRWSGGEAGRDEYHHAVHGHPGVDVSALCWERQHQKRDIRRVSPMRKRIGVCVCVCVCSGSA